MENLTWDKVLILMDRAYSSSQSELLSNAWSVETVTIPPDPRRSHYRTPPPIPLFYNAPREREGEMSD